nr:unnamed protein product [Callosobruchus analis]
MNLDLYVSGILVLFWFLTRVSVVLAIASAEKTEAETVTWEINSETIKGATEQGTTRDLADRTNTVSYLDTTTQPQLSTKVFPEETIFATQLYKDDNKTTDGDLVTESVTRSITEAVRGASETTQNGSITTSAATGGTTVPDTETTTSLPTTPPDYPIPGKPTIIEIDTTSIAIFVFWKTPTEPTGLINGYELTINPIGPLYPKWPNCYYDYNPKLIIVSGNDTRYTFMKTDPYYEYQLLLRACSSRGCGEYAIETAYTKESAPDNVEDVEVTIIQPTQVTYNGKVQIKFKSCRPNGNQTVYSITIHSDDDDVNENYTDIIDHGSTEAEVTLIKGYLNESNGKIVYIALILSEENVTGGDFSQWNGRQWPVIHNTMARMYYQITDDWWNPFKDKNEAKFTIGSGGLRNKPLVPDKGYYLIVRLFTSSFYRNSEVIYFKTGSSYTRGVVVGVVVGISLTLAVFGLLCFLMRKKITRLSEAERDLKKDDMLCKFIEHCKALDEDPDKLSSQFEAITTRGKEIVSERTSSFARLPENWRKNRYEKCFKYFPEKGKTMIVGDSMEIRCTTELHFGTYCEQYHYIYKLMRNHLEEPPGHELEDNIEHIYENISVIQNNQDSSDRIILESGF